MMVGLFLLFGCISSISAYTDVRADDVNIVTRKEFNDLKQELSRLKSHWGQLNKMKNDLDEIHKLKHQMNEFIHLNQQFKEMKEIKLQLTEFYEIKRQYKEMKHRLTEMDDMEKKLEEMEALKKELAEVKQQLSDMKRLHQQSKEMNDLKQEFKEMNDFKQHLKELNKMKKEMLGGKQHLKEKNERKEQRQALEDSREYFKENVSLKKHEFFIKTNKNITDIKVKESKTRLNKTKASKVMFSNVNNKTLAESRQKPVHISDDESNKRSFRRSLHQPTLQIRTPPSLNQVAFCAELSHALSNLGTFQTIVFDHVITNFGNAYNKNDGIFTAPVEGVYVLSWTTMSKPNLYQGTELVMDGQHVSYAWAAATTGYNSASKTVILHLKPGNEVWIRTDGRTGGSHYLHIYGFNSFVGFLLN